MVQLNFKEWIFGGKHFCFCLPTRAGVVIMSFLSLVFSALLAIIIWFEVYTTKTMGPKERAIFVTAGVAETFLLIASILGFSGAIAKKYLFLAIYAYFVYIHFFLNVAIAAYFLYIIENGSDAALVHGCQQGLKESQAQKQCEGLLKITKTAYLVIASLVLLIEMYGALIVTRYMRQLRHEKRSAKSRISAKSRSSHPSQGSEGVGLLMEPVTVPESQHHNPYTYYNNSTTTTMNHNAVSQNVEPGYGGGRWGYQDIYEEEKRAYRASLSTVEEDTTAERTSYHDKTPTTVTSNMRLPSLGDAAASPYSNSRSSIAEVQPPPYHGVPSVTHAITPGSRSFSQ